jgi:hypothetical protein
VIATDPVSGYSEEITLTVHTPEEPTPTQTPTDPPTETPPPTGTPVPTDTPPPTETPIPSETPTVDPSFALEGNLNSPDEAGQEITTDDDFDIIVNLWSWGATEVEFTITNVDETWIIQPTEGWTVEGSGLKWTGDLKNHQDHVEAVLHVPVSAVNGTVEFTVNAVDKNSGYVSELVLTAHTPEHIYMPVILNKP